MTEQDFESAPDSVPDSICIPLTLTKEDVHRLLSELQTALPVLACPGITGLVLYVALEMMPPGERAAAWRLLAGLGRWQ